MVPTGESGTAVNVPDFSLTSRRGDKTMALIRYGGGIVQMSGSIAGDTFARNRYGNYSRARTKPTNPNTARQQVVRAAVAELTARWAQTLTAGQRTAWNLYGNSVAMKNRLGEVIKLTGFNHYIRSNVIRIMAGGIVIDAGPVIFELPAQDPVFAVTASEATQTYQAAFDNTMDWANEDGGALVIFGGMPQNAQRNFFAGPWRFSKWLAGDAVAAPASPTECTSFYAIAELQRLWCYARIIRADGRISEPFRANTFCGA